LEEDEIDVVLEAFCEHVRGTATQDPRAILGRYGQDLNKILSSRSEKLVDRIKADGKFRSLARSSSLLHQELETARKFMSKC
jgi:hypothetical protein